MSTWTELPPWPTEDYGEPPEEHDAAVFEYMRLRAWVDWLGPYSGTVGTAMDAIRAGEWPDGSRP